MTNKNLSAVVIMDNAGGTTLKLHNDTFCHHYDYVEQAAQDYYNYLQDGNTQGWEGHQEELEEFYPEYEEQRNGGYKVFDMQDIEKMLAQNEENFGWQNELNFIKELKVLMNK